MEGLNLTQIIIAYAAPICSLLGIVAQCYFANRGSKERKEKEQRQGEKLDKSTSEITKQIETNTELAKENHRLIKENSTLIRDLTERLAANDVVTVSVARNAMRDLYYKIRPYKMISDTDYRAITELYNAYKGVVLSDGHAPNSWCDQLYHEMGDWERVETYPNGMHHITTAPIPLPKEEKKSTIKRKVK